jgi:hypothetical protein
MCCNPLLWRLIKQCLITSCEFDSAADVARCFVHRTAARAQSR